ncbi:hypothetical protein PQX77_019650 [Marasmius sp. AFHP31]|nr:hypothetical protein PQX77_019650 [Marasmius sp. AFHP31]
MNNSTAKTVCQTFGWVASGNSVTSDDLRSRFLAEYTKEVTEDVLKQWNEEVKVREDDLCVQEGMSFCSRATMERATRVQRVLAIDVEAYEIFVRVYAQPLEISVSSPAEPKAQGRGRPKKITKISLTSASHIVESLTPTHHNLEDLKRDNERMEDEIVKLCHSQVELKEKAAAARANLERFRDEQIKVHAEFMDQRDRERVERDEIVARLEYCKREREAAEARLEAKRNAPNKTRHQ